MNIKITSMKEILTNTVAIDLVKKELAKQVSIAFDNRSIVKYVYQDVRLPDGEFRESDYQIKNLKSEF
jgi:hypothetical protein